MDMDINLHEEQSVSPRTDANQQNIQIGKVFPVLSQADQNIPNQYDNYSANHYSNSTRDEPEK